MNVHRRQARQRREYLFQKGTEAKEHATFDRKRKVREAIEQGKAIPTELRAEADALRAQVELEPAAERLYVTYFEGNEALGVPADTAARDIWAQYVPPARILAKADAEEAVRTR